MNRIGRARLLLGKAIRYDYYKSPTPGTNPLGITFGAVSRRENNPKYIKKVITNRLGERQTVYINKEKLAAAANYSPTKSQKEAAKHFVQTGDLPSKKSSLSILASAPSGLGAIPGIMTANYANAFDEEKKKGQSTPVAAWKALSRGVEKGFEREAKFRDTAKQILSSAMESTIAGASIMIYAGKK